MNLRGWLRNEWDRALAVVAVLIGGLLLFLGWWGVSDTRQNWEQVPYLVSGAVGGLFALGIGATLWLSASMRDEWCKLDDLYTLMLASVSNAQPQERNGVRPAAEQSAPRNDRALSAR